VKRWRVAGVKKRKRGVLCWKKAEQRRIEREAEHGREEEARRREDEQQRHAEEQRRHEDEQRLREENRKEMMMMMMAIFGQGKRKEE
jgi:uncharacterized membrane protein YdbT with pleckstrin-like domain